MKNKLTVLIICGGFILTTAMSCQNGSDRKSKEDQFYTQKGEWDSARLPLIKPYEAVITSKKFGWFINLDGKDGDTGLPNINKVTVKQGVIYLYNVNSIFHGVHVKQSWHIIIPSRHVEKGFISHQEYHQYLNQMGIKQEPILYNIELVATYYENHDTIDWDAIAKL